MAYIVYSRTPQNAKKTGNKPKEYQDTQSGEIISNRQYLNRTKAIPQGFSTYGQKLSKQKPLSVVRYKLSKTTQTTYKLDEKGYIEGQILSIIDAIPNQSGISGITVVIEGKREIKLKSGKRSKEKRTGAQTRVEAPTPDGIADILSDIEEVEDKYNMGSNNAYYLIVIED